MLPQDLDIIEIDADFCVQINKKVAGQDNVSVHCCSILDWTKKKYDLIISTLPFNAFSYSFLESYDHICKLGSKDVTFSLY